MGTGSHTAMRRGFLSGIHSAALSLSLILHLLLLISLPSALGLLINS